MVEDEENMNLEDSTENETPKTIEVVSGEGDITISPVSKYIEVEKPKPKEKREIIVPEVKDEKKEAN